MKYNSICSVPNHPKADLECGSLSPRGPGVRQPSGALAVVLKSARGLAYSRTLSRLLSTFCVVTALSSFADQNRLTQNFDADWRFFKGDIEGADALKFDDANWRKLNVPHDWSIEGPFAKTNKTGGAGAFLPSGIGWYRKHFTLPANSSNHCAVVEFDGVMQNSDVWINGFHLGHRPNGYVSFSYDLTGHLNFGGDNVLAVRADTSEQPASRWYSGAGIYRHVRLVTTDRIHFRHDDIFVTTPEVSETEATVRIAAVVTNEMIPSRAYRMLLENISLEITLMDAKGNVVGSASTSAQKLPLGGIAQFSQDIKVKSPQLWNVDSPVLYRAVSKIVRAGKVVDETTNAFGIRHFEFKPETSFWLNGKNFKLYGVCLHHESGAFGAAVPIAIWESRLNTLRTLGINAIRTAHNPPAPEFLDLCDRMGFLVMDEFFDCWTIGKNPFDYHLYFDEWSQIDERDTVRRDRNHPSIILYSVGNEIHDTPNASLAKKILSGLVAVAHEADPSRPTTQALFRPNTSGDYTNGLADLLDVVGTNYRDNELLAAQREHPAWKIIGTEQRHDRQTWIWLRDNPSEAGQFLWTGVDYLGETRAWPLIGHASGLIDRTGVVKPMAFERQSWWSSKPVVHIARRVGPDDLMPDDPGYGGEERHTQVQFADWTPRKSGPHDETVEAYSNCGEVELFLNDKSLGVQKIHSDASPRVWKVPYEAGTLKAVAKNGGKVVANDELRTATAPAIILLETDHETLGTNWDDVAAVRVTIVDKDGIRAPIAKDLIHFEITGPGVISAVDNGDNSSHEEFQVTERYAYQGRCVAFVKATASGKFTVTATAAGIPAAVITINKNAK